ncbi:ATP-binding protein [Smaragdicoccus niigatensis]|uniref:sensor histidine kinase n=1 Tax=Smaragdicoccus niigatensis TaxID=359359 RepID=UPI0003796C41|nr:ATP-binding protein [Smaragdicoccus niigatensis]
MKVLGRNIELNPRRWGLRVQSALIVAIVVAATVLVYATGFVLMMYESLTRAANEAANTRADQVVAQFRTEPPGRLDVGVFTTDSNIVAVQVVDDRGVVVQASQGSPTTPLTDRRYQGPPDRSEGSRPDRPFRDLRLTTETVMYEGRSYRIIVATSYGAIHGTAELAATLAAIGSPLVVAFACLATYLVIGRSLRSVERIRDRVASISSSKLSGRVPVPEAKDEIAALARTMNEMLARLEAAHRAQQRFVSDASHELRSPLSTITAALEVGAIHPELLDAELVQTTLIPESERMRRLIEDLLLLARADEHGIPLHLVDVDLDGLVEDEVRRAQTVTTKSVVISVQPIQIQADPAQLGRAIRNVIDNAIKYASETVTINLVGEQGRAHLTIADDGPGVPEAEQARVFDRFYRVGDDRGRGSGGSGLGLAITAEIIAAHRGRIRLEGGSAGAIVHIELPLTS